MTKTIRALMLTSLVRDWLRQQTEARVLHVFDQACNLVSLDDQVVSLVKPELGPGPFAIVVPIDQSFRQLVEASTTVNVEEDKLSLGSVTVDTGRARSWQPRPPWVSLRQRCDLLLKFLPALRMHVDFQADGLLRSMGSAGHNRFAAAADLLARGLSDYDEDACSQAAFGLAGLGPGLTPTGDDFLVGAIYGLWATRPELEARPWTKLLAETAAPRTTRLSAAWLAAAGRGEAVEPWHQLVEAIGGDNGDRAALAVQRILAIGHSSGLDALAGFTKVIGDIAEV